MGCGNSQVSAEDESKSSEDKKINKDNNSDNSNNKENKDKNDKEKNSKDKDNNDSKNLQKSNKTNKKDENISNEDENKDHSNEMTGGINDTKKLNLKKKDYNGVLIMQGIDECIADDLDENDVYKLVEDALTDNIIENEDDKTPGKVTKIQAKTISKILYNKINKKEESDNNEVDLKDYPELKGLNIKVGVGQLTKEVIRKVIFKNQNVDESEIEMAYANLTKENDDLKALIIEILP